VEFQSAATIAKRYPQGIRDLADGGTWGTLAGQPTDDSELALALARSIVKTDGYDSAAVLEAYVDWYGSHPFDVGTTTSRALAAAARASSADERLQTALAVASTASQANGSLMRMSPLGVFAAGRIEPGVALAREDSRLTHPNPVCLDACAVLVETIAHAIEMGADSHSCYHRALQRVRNSEVAPEVRGAVEHAVSALPIMEGPKSGWVLVALQNAFFQLLHASSLEEGIIATVMRGGDTDTNAAIAGALLGAVHGRDAVPLRWRNAILSCRALQEAGARNPRPPVYWPVDAYEVAEGLLLSALR